MTWVAYYSDLSEVAVFGVSGITSKMEVELKARRYAMENSMSIIDLPDGAGLRETINAPARESASDVAHRLLGPDIPATDEPSLLASDLAALVHETLDLQGSVRFWYSQTAKDMVRIEQYAPGRNSLEAQGNDLSQALIDYRVREAQQS